MPDRKRVKRKMAGFMTDGPTTKPEYLNEYRKIVRALTRHPRREQLVTEMYIFANRKKREILDGV